MEGVRNASFDPPDQIGRYRIEKVLGKGGFGLVYLASDDQLQRLVAIKVPHAHLVEQPEQAEAYLTEARTVANLDHPNIVPVYDVGSSDQFPCFVVSKYIDGIDLATKIRQTRFSIHKSVELLATIADALHYAHKKGLVHRDIKPENILLDKQGHPFVADFGLALREQDIGKGPRYVGTPAYMSPEQSRGEGHRVDGRCDIFSLGVVFYQLLTGRRPFMANSPRELLEQICKTEVRPPRQIDDSIAKELERICLKALAKRATERYTTASDFSEDLRCYLAKTQSAGKSRLIDSPTNETLMATPGATLQTMPTATPLSAESHPIKIVPKGLRSFDAHDADFFLELLPGARDREGLPDSIRFWKNGIEELDADHTFPVGLIYGPSGCGKSSLVKAGLLPRLSSDVIAVYIEATSEETETRLLNGLRKCCPEMPIDLALIETFAFIRRGQGITSGKKIIVFLDQFEQWLHAKKDDENTELAQALRQCDGGRIQCIVMVRDDFWMSATRFMRELEVRLLEGQNSSAVDLFPIRHAENVLAAFGRAFGILPAKTTDTSNEQLAFVKQGVAGLAQEGKVISVRLSLFAEMMKGKSWTPASLKSVGGAEGVGVAFLEETFSAANAPPEHRYHQEAARAVLKLLLPESGTDIKGHMRSHRELLEVSGYENRPKDFHDLIRILDREIRLITPTDPDGLHDSSSNRRATSPKANASSIGEVEIPVDESTRLPEVTRYYQLSHDYLVPSLREWLTRKQGETRRGRAELLLADRAAVWNARLENRQLPSLWQWIKIRWWTPRKHWTISQQKMMSKASRRHLVRGGIALVIIAMLAWFGYEIGGYEVAKILRDRLLVADTSEVPSIIKEMRSVRRWGNTLLRDAAVERETNTWHNLFSVQNGDYSPESADYAKRILQLDPRKKLHISLALLPDDVSQVKPLYHRLLNAEPNEVAVIRHSLAPYKVDLIEDLWKVMESKDREQAPQRLRAAAALALYDPSNEKWGAIKVEVADELVNVPAVYLATWLDALRPIRKTLLPPVFDIYRNVSRRELERALATDILKAYASDDPNVLAELLKDASNP